MMPDGTWANASAKSCDMLMLFQHAALAGLTAHRPRE